MHLDACGELFVMLEKTQNERPSSIVPFWWHAGPSAEWIVLVSPVPSVSTPWNATSKWLSAGNIYPKQEHANVYGNPRKRKTSVPWVCACLCFLVCFLRGCIVIFGGMYSIDGGCNCQLNLQPHLLSTKGQMINKHRTWLQASIPS